MQDSKIVVMPIPNPTNTLNQAYQQKGVQFAFVNKVEDNKYLPIHCLVLCRDYLGDVVYTFNTGTKMSQFGFTTKTTWKLDSDKTRILMTFPTKEDFDSAIKNISILNNIEQKNDWELTKLHLCSPIPISSGVSSVEYKIIVEGDVKWRTSILSISLFTYLLRVISYDFKDPNNWIEELLKNQEKSNEKQYLREVSEERFIFLIENLNKIGQDKQRSSGWESTSKEGQEDYYHNYSGFRSCIIPSLTWHQMMKDNTYKQDFDILWKGQQK